MGQLHDVAAVSVHGVDVDVVAPFAVGAEGDLRPVGRPSGIGVVRAVVREPAKTGPSVFIYELSLQYGTFALTVKKTLEGRLVLFCSALVLLTRL